MYTSGMVEEKDKLNITAKAEGAIAPFRICQFGSASNGVIQATAASQFPVGISGNASENGKSSYVAGDPVTLTRQGIKYLEMSGTGVKGNRVVSNTDAKGIAHTTGDNSWIVGVAMEAWVDGQVIPVDMIRQFIGEAVGA